MKKNRNFYYGLIIGTIVAGTMTFFFMHHKLLTSQKQYMQDHIISQTELVDSLRRIDLGNLMIRVLDKVYDELKNNPKHSLSDETIAQISSVSFAFQPYLNFTGDSLTEKKSSRERGQLLLMLSKMNIDSGSLSKIMFQTNFSGATLKDADLSKANLAGANLKGADFQDVNLQGANLYGANLRSANLWGANLSKAILDGADLTNADLRWTNMNGVNLKRAILNDAEMASAQLRKADLRGAGLQWTGMDGAILQEANMSGANMFRVNLVRAQLQKSDLSETNLTWADFTEADLTGADLRGANLTTAVLKGANIKDVYLAGAELNGALVSENNWLTLLDEWLVKGASEIQNSYKIVEEIHKKKTQYRLEKIKK